MSLESSPFSPPANGEAAHLVPTLPSLPTLPPATPPGPMPDPPTVTAPAGGPPPLAGLPLSDTKPRGRFGPTMAIVLLLGAAAALVGFGLTTMSGDSADEPSPVAADAPTPTTPAENTAPIFEAAQPDESNVLIEPITDAADVVDQIDDNGQEVELLDELGLDPVGNPLPAGYALSWTYDETSTSTVIVDSTTGDYTFTSYDGVEYRRIGDEAFGRVGSASPWKVLDPAITESTPRLGLDGPVTLSDILDPVDGYATPPSSTDGVTITFLVDEGKLGADSPEKRSAWRGLVGLDPDAPAATGYSISVSALVDADGERLTSFTVVIGDVAAVYRLDAVYDEPPVIERPEV